MSDIVPLFLSLDFGTESVRATVFDLSGTPIFSAQKTYPTYFSQNGWAEQDQREWYDALISVVCAIVEKAGARANSIEAITVDSTLSTLMLLDKQGKELHRAILWMDVRATREADIITRVQSDRNEYYGYKNIPADWMLPKALWFKHNRPREFEKAFSVCDFQDWVNFILTGNMVSSMNSVTSRWLYNGRKGGWPVDLYNAIGASELIEKVPPRVLDLGEFVGTITKQFSDATGLSKKTKVLQGGSDAYIGMLGLGVTNPGEVALITGSSHLILGHTEKPLHAVGVYGTFPDAVIPGLHVIEGGQTSTGSTVRWFKDNFTKDDMDFTSLNTSAASIPLGSEGLIVVDHWQGNRTPHMDFDSRGIIRGLSLNHTPIHIYRAILEGICYGIEYSLASFRQCGYQPCRITSGGGATKSDLWMSIQSDVIGMPIHISDEIPAPLLGDAVIAAYGCGYYSSFEQAVEAMVRIRKTVEPDMKNHMKYRFFVDQYKKTYINMQKLMKEMAEHRALNTVD